MLVLRLICCRSHEKKVHDRAVDKERIRRDLFSPGRGLGDQKLGVPSCHVARDGPLGGAAHALLLGGLRQLVDEKGCPVVAEMLDYESFFEG